MEQEISRLIRDIPDFPVPGIIFKDITPLLQDAAAFKKVIDDLAARYAKKEISKVVGIESRGFIFGAALAYRLDAGFIPIRKAGKLPYETIRADYELEYGTASMEIHVDAIAKGERVVIIDDLLATGGTLAAACEIIDKLGGEIVEVFTLIELGFLNGRKKLEDYNFESVIVY